MNDALNSPFHDLTLSYLSYGFMAAVNSVWAWMTVVTTALGFWKARALSPPPVSRLERRSSGEDAAYASDSASPPEPAVASDKPLATETTPYCGTEGEGSSKVKFSVYYGEDAFGGINERGGESESNGGVAAAETVGEEEELGFSWCDWERKMVVRMGDMGWYTCQDLTVLDGSVVRLWRDRPRQRRRDAATLNGVVR